MKIITAFAVGLALAAALPAAPAQAQNQHSFVSSQGLDTNNCTLAAPCRHLQAALAVTIAGGEIVILDSAGYNNATTVTISQPVSIVNPGGFEAEITAPSGGTAIVISAMGGGEPGAVSLRGLTIDGGGIGHDGITLSVAASLTIVNCVIQNFTHDGIYLQPTGVLAFSILNTIASGNGNDGIDLSPSGTSGGISGIIDHATATNNGVDGMNVWGDNSTSGYGGPGGLALITIVNSVAANNGNNGINANTTAGHLSVSVMIRDTTASNNLNSGVQADGVSKIILAHSEAAGNGTGIIVTGSAGGYSFGDNHIYGNGLYGTTNVAGTLVVVPFY
jgi:hypothetical protein